MSENPKISKERYEELKEELENLSTVERKKIAKDLVDARAQGDLSENSEYHEARKALGECDSRIGEIEKILKFAEIIDGAEHKNEVCVGCTVEVEDSNRSRSIYKIVDPVEADILANKLSKASPLGQALLYKKKGDKVEVKLPSGKSLVTIISIS